MDEIAMDNPNPVAQTTAIRAEHSNSNMLSKTVLQKVQIEKLRLDFLSKCRLRKRPPPTLRCTGFKALNEEERIKMISEAETRSLLKAIEKKKRDIKLLESQIKKTDSEVCKGLSKRAKQWWVKHFNQKLNFYKMKEASEWLLWPRKFCNKDKLDKHKKKNTLARSKRNFRRKEQKLEKTASEY